MSLKDQSLGVRGMLFLLAKSEIDGPFAVINADDFYGKEGL